MRLCFAGVNPTTCFRRLRKLENEGYLVRAVGLPMGKIAWYLGKAGAAQIGAEITPRFTNKNSLVHDATTTEIRLALESIGLAREFTTDREIRSKMTWQTRASGEHVIPDGILIENVNAKFAALALEVELNAKAYVRYIRIFKEYAWKKNISYVWYVVASKAIAKAVLTCWPKVKHFEFTPKILITELEDLLKNGAHSLMQTEGGEVKPLREFFTLDAQIKNGAGAKISQSGSPVLEEQISGKTPHAPAHTLSTQEDQTHITNPDDLEKQNHTLNEIEESTRAALPAIDHPISTIQGGRLQYACGKDELL